MCVCARARACVCVRGSVQEAGVLGRALTNMSAFGDTLTRTGACMCARTCACVRVHAAHRCHVCVHLQVLNLNSFSQELIFSRSLLSCLCTRAHAQTQIRKYAGTNMSANAKRNLSFTGIGYTGAHAALAQNVCVLCCMCVYVCMYVCVYVCVYACVRACVCFMHVLMSPFAHTLFVDCVLVYECGVRACP